MYSVIGTNSAVANLLDLPLAVQEMVLAVWMIARGFQPAVGQVDSESGPHLDAPSAGVMQDALPAPRPT